MGTKNNPDNRGESAKGKTFNSKPVEPVLFIDPEKRRKYMAAQYIDNGDLVTDSSSGDGEPLPWDAITG